MTTLAGPHPTLHRAARFHLIGRLFARPFSGWVAEVRSLADELGDDPLGSSLDRLEGFTEGRYLRLLGPGGALSPREVAYRPMADPGKTLADLGGYYQAFAFRPAGAEPLDHVAVETGFLGFLTLKEAFAEERDDHEGAAVCRAAARSFGEDHLGALAHGIASRLAALAGEAPVHLLAAARALTEMVGAEPGRGLSLPILGPVVDPFAARSPCGVGIFDSEAGAVPPGAAAARFTRGR